MGQRTSTPLSALLVSAGGQRCAFALEHVREVMRPQPTQPVASSLAFVRGVALLHGQPAPVIDLAALLGTGHVTEAGRLVALNVDGRTVALAVDSVVGFHVLEPSILADLPPLLRDGAAEYVDRLSRLDTDLVIVLRSARLVPESLWTSLGAQKGAAP